MIRAQIVSVARGWIGTPYVHQASAHGHGADCLGLVRGVWRECLGAEPQHPPPYAPDWAEHSGDDVLLQAFRCWFVERAFAERQPGDVLLFRLRPDCRTKHCAILSAPTKIIHAYWGRAVTETHLVPWWQRRIAAVFSFPHFQE